MKHQWKITNLTICLLFIVKHLVCTNDDYNKFHWRARHIPLGWVSNKDLVLQSDTRRTHSPTQQSWPLARLN